MDILDDMGVSELSAKVFSKVNYSFKCLFYGTLSICAIRFQLRYLKISFFLFTKAEISIYTKLHSFILYSEF